MIVKTREVIELEYRWMKRFARVLLLAVMAFPIFNHAPLLWKDGSYEGRWAFAATLEPQPLECRGYPYILQFCELKFAEKNGGQTMAISYMLMGANWTGALPDIIRSSTGHYSSTIATSGPGLLQRAGALIGLFIFGVCIEQLVLSVLWRSMIARVPVIVPEVRSTETVMLSRDRRDHI